MLKKAGEVTLKDSVAVPCSVVSLITCQYILLLKVIPSKETVWTGIIREAGTVRLSILEYEEDHRGCVRRKAPGLGRALSNKRMHDKIQAPWTCINSRHQKQGHLHVVGRGHGRQPPLLPGNTTKEAFYLTDCKPDLIPRNKVLQSYLKCSSEWISILYNKQNQKEKELGKYVIDIENATWRKLLGFIYSYSLLCMKRLARYYIIIMDCHSSLRINGSYCSKSFAHGL